MKIDIAVSARHVHLSEEDYKILFLDEELNCDKELSQYPNFASDKFVTLKNGEREINNVRVVGPFRSETQVELSKTECRYLKIDAPLSNSNELDEAGEIEIVNGDKSIIRNAVIIQNRHIHMNYEDAKNYGYSDDQVVRVKIDTKRGGIMDDVHIKLGEKFLLELHIDTDDANAFLIDETTEGEILND